MTIFPNKMSIDSFTDLDRMPGALSAVVQNRADNPVKLETLDSGQLSMIDKAATFSELTDDYSRKVRTARIDLEREILRFMQTKQSKHTRIAYMAGISHLKTHCSIKGLNLLEMRYSDADDYITFVRGAGWSSASIRLDVAACSSFFSWMERRHDGLKNPFRGTRERPKKKPVRETVIPTGTEISIIAAELEGHDRAAVAVMAGRGLRVGALPSLKIRGNRFTAESKGKEIAGEMPPDVMKEVKKLGSHPFAGKTVSQLSDRFRYVTKKLHDAGKIKAAYSPHDLRHYFAVDHYTWNKDIYALSKLLHHAGIAVTESYLKSLSVAGV